METKEWVKEASEVFSHYAAVEALGHPFLAEDVRENAYRYGLIDPEDPRLWGQAARRALKDGGVVRAGFASARTSNGSPKVLWKARVR